MVDSKEEPNILEQMIYMDADEEENYPLLAIQPDIRPQARPQKESAQRPAA